MYLIAQIGYFLNQCDGTMKRYFENYSRLLFSAKMVLLFSHIILKN